MNLRLDEKTRTFEPGSRHEVADLVALVHAALAAGQTVTVSTYTETLSPSEAAAELGISRSGVQRRIVTGEIKAIRVGDRYRVSAHEVDRYRRLLVRTNPSPKVPSHQSVYRLRPPWIHRPESDVYVPAKLGALKGPTSGRHDPPVHLYWQPGDLDFARLADIELFYSSALAAATTAEQFAQWVNHDVLIATWDHLSLPPRVRAAWETIHPNLRSKDTQVNDRIRIQDVVLAAIADHGFALAGGSALIDYDVVSRDTDDIDAFNNRWDVGVFDAALHAILGVCSENGWTAETVLNEDFRKRVVVDAGSGAPVVVDMVYYERSQNPERRTGGGLRLIFDDVAGGKGVAVAESSRGRDLFDLANIVETPGWSLSRVEDAMKAIKYADKIEQFRGNLDRFRRGEFDADISKSGFDPAFCHRILD
ncbi:excisionase [Mycobacteroides abscessus subsp. abscessus]|nr:excisionase [Mycobacteroides abscessus subsp. abscessus]